MESNAISLCAGSLIDGASLDFLQSGFSGVNWCKKLGDHCQYALVSALRVHENLLYLGACEGDGLVAPQVTGLR